MIDACAAVTPTRATIYQFLVLCVLLAGLEGCLLYGSKIVIMVVTILFIVALLVNANQLGEPPVDG